MMCGSYFVGEWWYGIIWAGSFDSVIAVAILRDFRDDTVYVWPDRVI